MALVVLYAVVLIRIGTVVYAHRRARSDVSGHSVRQERAEGAALAVALVAVYVLMGAFAGPRGVWLSNGVGLCVVLLGYSAAQVWVLRASRSER